MKPDDFNKPFKFFLKKAASVAGSQETTKLISLYFKEVEVQTDKGLFMESMETKGSMSIDSVLIDTLDRGFGATSEEQEPVENKGLQNQPKASNRILQQGSGGGGGGGAAPAPTGTKNPTRTTVSASYIEFYLYSSNNKLIFTRKYTKIVDVFASIGGISEVIGFVVIFCYAWYNGIKMEQKLLNFGVLNKQKERSLDKVKAKEGNDDSDWEKERFFTFGELVKFGLMEKGMSCCFKDQKIKKRKEFYDRVNETKETRTDVINIMKSVADIDTIKEALLTPYQQRLIHYLATAKDDDQANEKEMSIKEAIKELNKEGKKNTLIQHQFDAYLKQNLPAGILEGKLEQFDSSLEDPSSEPFNKLDIKNSLQIASEKNSNELLSPGLGPQESLRKRKGDLKEKSLGLNTLNIQVQPPKRRSIVVSNKLD